MEESEMDWVDRIRSTSAIVLMRWTLAISGTWLVALLLVLWVRGGTFYWMALAVGVLAGVAGLRLARRQDAKHAAQDRPQLTRGETLLTLTILGIMFVACVAALAVVLLLP